MTKPVRVELSDRFFALLESLEAHGGTREVHRKAWADELGVPLRSFSTMTARAVELQLVAIERDEGYVIGDGRPPNRYRLLVPVAQWRAEGPAISDALAAQRSAANRAERTKARNKRANDAKRERKVGEALAVLDAETSLTAQARAVVLAEADDPTLDVDAWLKGVG